MIDVSEDGIDDGYYKLTINDATANTYTGGTEEFNYETVVFDESFCLGGMLGGGGAVEGGVRCFLFRFESYRVSSC